MGVDDSIPVFLTSFLSMNTSYELPQLGSNIRIGATQHYQGQNLYLV